LILNLCACVGCASLPPEPLLLWTAPLTNTPDSSIIINHRDESLPQWVEIFYSYGERGIEALSQYRACYAFVCSNRGANKDALQLWSDSFNPSIDFPLMVARRVADRFVEEAETYPDYWYGAFFETAVKTVADAAYSGAAVDSSYWCLKRYPSNYEVYDFLVLVIIEKQLLQTQLLKIFEQIEQIDIPARKEQKSAISSAIRHFFDYF
jgi:hypothetical protein